MDVSEKKQKTTEQIIRLYVSTILVFYGIVFVKIIIKK